MIENSFIFPTVQLSDPLPEELDDVAETGTPPTQRLFELQFSPFGQSLSFKQRYLQILFVQSEPNGQLSSLVQEYLHKLLLQTDPLGQLLFPVQLTTLPLELAPAIGPPEPLNGFPNGTPLIQR